MKYVLDTNAVSALMRGDRAVVDRLRRMRRPDVFIPQPAVAEIEYGIQRLARSKRRDALAARLAVLLRELARIPWDDDVSAAFGLIKASLEKRGVRIEDLDAAVAAHALAHDAILVTANVKHMARVASLRVEDWSRDE